MLKKMREDILGVAGDDGRNLGNGRCCAVKLSEVVQTKRVFQLSNRQVICFS